MTEEQGKLIAKIQHFYELMIRRLQHLEDTCLTTDKEAITIGCREKSVEISLLSDEFAKTFENFLYLDQKLRWQCHRIDF